MPPSLIAVRGRAAHRKDVLPPLWANILRPKRAEIILALTLIYDLIGH